MSNPVQAVFEPQVDGGLYENDEHQWIAEQISALADGDFHRIDRKHLIEYLTDMTIRDRRELRSRLTVLLLHLLKVQYQPARVTRSWAKTILDRQEEVRSIIEGIPSLGRQADAIAAAAYPDAVRRTARETGLPPNQFPAASPWSAETALAFDPPEPAARGKRHQ